MGARGYVGVNPTIAQSQCECETLLNSFQCVQLMRELAGSAAQCCHLDCFPFIPSCPFHPSTTSLFLPNNKMLILVSSFLFLPSLFSGKCERNKKEALIHHFTFILNPLISLLKKTRCTHTVLFIFLICIWGA